MLAPRRLSVFVLALLAACCAIGCQKPAPAPQPEAAEQKALSAAAPQPQAALKPPQLPFQAPAPWVSRKGGDPVQPPDVDAQVWRAFVTQNQPLQIKTPKWQSLAPRETVEVAMPEISKFRCVVTPLAIVADTNDFNTKLKAWVLTRRLLCSDDGWHSWTEYSHTTRILPDGTTEMQSVPQALLREREADESIRETFVLLRSDKEQLEAYTGPPRILPGVKVDED